MRRKTEPQSSGSCALLGGLLATFIVISATSEAADESLTPVRIARVQELPATTELRLTGTVVAPTRSEISSQVDGLVAEINADIGDEVAAGETIVRLDHELATIDVARAEAAVSEAQARKNEAKRRVDEARRLIDSKHISATELAARDAELAAQFAVLATRRSELRRLRKVLELHTIRAPFDGVVTERNVDKGAWINRGTTLVDLLNLDKLRVEIAVPQSNFLTIGRGTPVDLSFESLPGVLVQAAVTNIVPELDDASRSFPALIELENPERKLTPGMSARATFYFDETAGTKSVAVPRDAVVLNSNGKETVWVVDTNDNQTKVRDVTIVTGTPIGAFVTIKAGELQPGMHVVIRGNEILKRNQTVRIVDAPSTES